jgi:hypothetical protein
MYALPKPWMRPKNKTMISKEKKENKQNKMDARDLEFVLPVVGTV